MWHLPVQLARLQFSRKPNFRKFYYFPIMLISVSLFYGWLTLRSSFIPAAIAHGAFNTIEEGVISNINLEVPMLYLILIKLLVTVMTGLLFMYLVIRNSTREYKQILKK
ncbi:MAG: hypothetical protein IPO92_05390 [Saprospiraceae bacterium]|nr:hypothetical protein [Saprospiraceae bacterium]